MPLHRLEYAVDRVTEILFIFLPCLGQSSVDRQHGVPLTLGGSHSVLLLFEGHFRTGGHLGKLKL